MIFVMRIFTILILGFEDAFEGSLVHKDPEMRLFLFVISVYNLRVMV